MARARKRTNTSNPVPPHMTAKQIKRKKPIDKSYMVPINPLTPNQEAVFEQYAEGQNILLHGAAGIGKTFITLYLALQEIF